MHQMHLNGQRGRGLSICAVCPSMGQLVRDLLLQTKKAQRPPRQTLLCPLALTSAGNDGAADNQARTEHADDAHGLPKCQRGNNGGPEGLGGE